MNISQVLGVKDDRIDVQDIFFFERVGVTEAGKVQGRFRGAGHEPKIMERLRVGTPRHDLSVVTILG
jgi:pilus assembly protein CpaF